MHHPFLSVSRCDKIDLTDIDTEKSSERKIFVPRRDEMKYLAVILGIFGLELGIKQHVEKRGSEGETKEVCHGLLLLRKHHNKGAFLNAGQSRQSWIMLLSLLLTLGVTAVFISTLSMAGKDTLKWGLTLLLGGAYSNTYDRLVRKYVVDYVSFNVPFEGLRKVIFNIGDFCIMIGALLSVLGYWKKMY